MNVYKKIMDVVATVEKLVLCVGLAFITGITFANVVVRKMTDSQFAWTEEMVINIFILLVMLGCALCAREGSLISLSLVFDMLKNRGKKIFVSIITVANIAFYLVLMKTGFDKVAVQLANGKRTFSLGWPEWVFTIFLPIGCVFLILHTIEFFVDVMNNNAACINTGDEGGKV